MISIEIKLQIDKRYIWASLFTAHSQQYLSCPSVICCVPLPQALHVKSMAMMGLCS
jgi:hypothetical protein